LLDANTGSSTIFVCCCDDGKPLKVSYVSQNFYLHPDIEQKRKDFVT